LIGLKIQAFVNNPRRTQDLEYQGPNRCEPASTEDGRGTRVLPAFQS
jgi:hypothetical protein